MFYFLVSLYLIYVGVKIYLANLEINFVRTEAKKPAVVLSEDEYKDAAQIKVQNQQFEIISAIYGAVCFLIWLFWGLGALYEAALGGEVSVTRSIIFVMSFIVIDAAAGLPLEIYSKFVKDKKQGFSNITPKIFALDTLKTLALTLAFGSLFVYIILRVFELLGELWWLWAFCVSFAIILIINLIYPTLIAPIFNKVKPLEDGELKSSIENLLSQCGFKSSGVFTMDASKRDNRLNAYFGGFGATKRVVLFDTLVAKLNLDEIIAVLGHELGHFKHKDIFKMIALSAVMMFTMFGVFGNVPAAAYEALGLRADGASVIVFMLVFSNLLYFIFSPVIAYFSRKNEFGADKFGSSVKSNADMISALKKLGSENRAFPKSHPLYAAIYHSHPSLYERINELEKEAK